MYSVCLCTDYLKPPEEFGHVKMKSVGDRFTSLSHMNGTRETWFSVYFGATVQ